MVENYLLKLRYTNDMKSKNDIDFGFLTIKNRNRKKKNNNSRLDDSAQSSFYNDANELSQNQNSFSNNFKRNLSFGQSANVEQSDRNKNSRND